MIYLYRISLSIYKLSILEIENKVKKSRKLFDKLLNILYSRRKLIEDRILWKELYNLSIFFYPYTKTIGNIPLYMVTGHHQVVPWYIKKLKSLSRDIPIIHFDTIAILI